MLAGRRAMARQKSTASRVQLGPLAPACQVPPAWPGQRQLEVLAVPVGPLGHHVRDDHAVVLGGQPRLRAGGRGDVQPVHPRVPGQDHVDQVAERPGFPHPVHLLEHRHGPAAHEDRGATAAGCGLRSARGETRGDPLRRPVRALVHLELGERVEVDAAGPGQPGRLALLPEVLPDRGGHLGHAEHVGGHLADVPGRAVSRQGPLGRAQGPEHLGAAVVLGGGQAHGHRPGQGGFAWVHRGAFPRASRGRRRTWTSPGGSGGAIAGRPGRWRAAG